MLLIPYFVACFNDFPCFRIFYNSLSTLSPPLNDVNIDIT